MTPYEIKAVRAYIETIENKFSDEHKKNTFWCPKDMDVERKQQGYILYAYGGQVLKLYVVNGRIHFSLFDRDYERYFVTPERKKTWGKIKDKYDAAKKNEGNDQERLDRLMAIEDGDWEIILNAFKERADSPSGLNCKHFERSRQTAIARLNDGTHRGGVKIIEMESKMRVKGKKPDLIGIRAEDDQVIFSYIEYKCTTSAMNGNCRPVDHLIDMKEYYKTNYTYFEQYDQRLDENLVSLSAIGDTKKEMLFLFSHVGVENSKEGMTVQKAINGLNEMKKYGLEEDVKIAIIKDEEEKICGRNIKSIDEALVDLEKMK